MGGMAMERRLAGLLLALSLLLCGCGVPAGSETETTGNSVEPTVFYHDWILEGQWKVTGDESGNGILTSSGNGVETAWLGGSTLGDSWEVTVQVQPAQTGCARILLGNGNHESQAAVSVTFTEGKAELGIETRRKNDWKNVTSGESVAFDPDSPLVLTVWHETDSLRLFAAVRQRGETVSELLCEEITQRMYSAITTVGVGAENAAAAFSDFTLTVPENVVTVMDELLHAMSPEDAGFYTALAKQAVEDIVTNFWLGDAQDGQIIPTWDGYPGDDLPDSRGGLWEAEISRNVLWRKIWRLPAAIKAGQMMTAAGVPCCTCAFTQ